MPMTTMKRLLSAALALALGASLLAGCGAKTGEGSASSSSASSGASSSQEETPAIDLTQVTDPYLTTLGMAGDTVVATVGEYEITADSLAYWLNMNIAYLQQQYAMFGMTDFPWDTEVEEGVTQEQELLNSALRLAACYRLMPEIGAKEGVSIPQESLDALEKDMATLESQLNGPEQVEHYFWMNMLTAQLFREMYLAAEMAGELQEKYYGEGSEGYPTDAEVLAYAQDELGYYRAKHILLKTVDTTQTVEKEDGTTGYAPLDEATVQEKKAKKRAEKEAAERRQKAQSGSLSCIGLPELVPGRFVGVAGLDPDLDLDYYIREVQHEFGSDGFSTSLTLGGWE